ncbi:MAG: single-stranded-DNA-specific exonuclease RecJ [Lachnospirales bacterium]
MSNWVIRKKTGDVKNMAKLINKSEIFCQVLLNRNINTKRRLNNFMQLSYEHDISTMKDLNKAIEMIIEAIGKNKKITLYGDYDVDGVTSTTIFYKSLMTLEANVTYYIPHREKEGYGLNKRAIEEFYNDGIDLLITLDNGIASLEENRYIKELGIDLIVIDHHEAPRVEGSTVEIEPMGDAIIDPKQSVCDYPFKQMCTAGLVYQISKYLFYKLNKEFIIDKELNIFSMIGTFCDIVDLKEDNRIIASLGLDLLNKNKNINIGLHALLKEKSIYKDEIREYHIGFIIGPCINASGRLSEATLAVKLFTTDDQEEATNIAKELVALNEERKKLTDEAIDNAIRVVEEEIKDEKVYVIYDGTIHESIAGIVAGRIKDKYYHPTIVLTNGEESLKGSARSIECYNIFDALSQCKKYFLRFGGHSMAAGLSLSKENLEIFKNEINRNANLTSKDFIEIIPIDMPLPLESVSYELAKELELLKPFGKDNKQPIFGSKNIKILELRLIEEKNTIIFTLEVNEYRNIKAISFGKVSNFIEVLENKFTSYEVNKIKKGILRNVDLKIDIVYYIDINEYKNNFSVQLKVKDFRLSEYEEE